MTSPGFVSMIDCQYGIRAVARKKSSFEILLFLLLFPVLIQIQIHTYGISRLFAHLGLYFMILKVLLYSNSKHTYFGTFLKVNFDFVKS